MRTKHTPRVSEYESSISSHQLMIDIKQFWAKLYIFFETSYSEMQRKHITRVYEYQLSTSSQQLMIDIKH